VLERRVQLSGVSEDLGTLNGRAYRQGNVAHLTSDTYFFHLPRAGVIDLQLSRMIGKARMVIEQGDLALSNFLGSTPFSSNDHEFTMSVPAGDYFVDVQSAPDTGIIPAFYTVAISADYAPGQQVSGSSDFRADRGRDMGILSESSTATARDFLGFLDTSGHDAGDFIDTYFFEILKNGFLQVHEEGATADVANPSAKVTGDISIYRNFDGDNRLEAGKLLSSGHFDIKTNSQASATLGNASAGKYIAVVSHPAIPAVNDDTGGTNYKLEFFYDAADAAGNSTATAKDIGTLGNNTQTFNDYLSSVDATDVYKFTTVAGQGGPFVFDGTLSGFTRGDFDIELLNSSGTVLASRTTRGTVAEHLTRTGLPPGTYFVRAPSDVGAASAAGCQD
jgi:hypothetical protein